MAGKGLTPDKTIAARVKAARRSYTSEQDKFNRNCDRFADSLAQSVGIETDTQEDADHPKDQNKSVGIIPHLRTNILTKLATICGWRPDWRFKMRPDGEELAELAREGAKEAWNKVNATYQARRAAMNRFVGAVGIITYGWNEEDRIFVECVRNSDFAPDPYTRDWTKMRYASRTIIKPPDEVRKMYPRFKNLFGDSKSDAESDTSLSSGIELTLYFDKTTEAVMYKETVLDSGPNLYGELPFLFYQGDIDPKRFTHTGDYDHAYPQEYMLNILETAIKNQALHGGSLTIINPAGLEQKTRDALEDGDPLSLIEAKGDPEALIHRVPAEQLNPALLQIYGLLKTSADESVAVTPTQRGSASDIQFATQEMAINNLAGARTNDEREKFETLCTEIMKRILFLIVAFEEPNTDEEAILLEAYGSVASAEIVESSTVYKDPIATKQDAEARLNKAIEVDEYLMTIGSTKRVRVDKAYEDYLRTHDIRDTQEYFYEVTMSPGLPPGQGTSPSGADTPAPAPDGNMAMVAA